MATPHRRFPRSALALACGVMLTAAAFAQTGAPSAQSIVITGRAPATTVAGFGEVAPARAPITLTSSGPGAWADTGVGSIGALTRLDASVADAYNAEGYWSSIAVRGFGLDNRFNVQRDGLPINAETAIALDNKERIELLKGTSGAQAGTSSPGGLLNLVVKRPVAGLRSVRVQARDAASVLAAVDISERFAPQGRLGLRLNIAGERLDPAVRNTRGERSLLAVAADWQATPSMLLQAEAEASRQRQPSVSGFSLLGDRVPAATEVDARRNLNDQPWRQPVEFEARTTSLRLVQRVAALGEGGRVVLHAMQQQLRTDDRTAFPYGLYDPADYSCTWCDRFGPDGRFTYWEYVSDDERRDSRALALTVAGTVATGRVTHRFEAGVLRTRHEARFQDQIFDIAGFGRIDGSLVTGRSSGFTDANTDRDERSSELFVRNAMQLAPAWQLWAGARHVRLERAARRTSPDGDGSLRATRFERAATSPWLALAWQASPKTLVYASHGRGLETDVAPNRPRYANAGESLAVHSRQTELGVKHGSRSVEASLTAFDIGRDTTADLGACDAADSCRRALDGTARHRGLEATWQHERGAWAWQASAMWLQARREGSALPGVNGRAPANVPRHSLRLAAEHRVAALPGLALLAGAAAEGARGVLPYEPAVRVPGWSRIDLGLRWRTTPAPGVAATWRLALDNATDRRAWKEAPYQFGHAYLYPLMPRSWRASVQLEL